MSEQKRQLLADSDDHVIVFEKGKMVETICPRRAKTRQTVKQEKKRPAGTGASKKNKSEKNQPKDRFTYRQGQYLAFLHYYSVLNGRPPAHSDFVKYFKTTPPAVNQMLKTLEKKGLIKKVAGAPRSLTLLISRQELPELEPIRP